jgi:hypothetical protein
MIKPSATTLQKIYDKLENLSCSVARIEEDITIYDGKRILDKSLFNSYHGTVMEVSKKLSVIIDEIKNLHVPCSVCKGEK